MSGRGRACGFLACLLAFGVTDAGAEFYRWIDARGQPRVSNVAPPGVRNDGRFAPHRHPLAPAAQLAALRARLAARDATLAGRAGESAPAAATMPEAPP